MVTILTSALPRQTKKPGNIEIRFVMACEGNFQAILAKLMLKTTGPQGVHGCVLWTGAKSDAKAKVIYGRVVNPFPDTGVKRIFAHKAIFYLNEGHSPAVGEGEIDGETGSVYEISHLCHTPLCVNINHLVREPHAVNLERIHCKQQGHCTRAHMPPCLL